MWVGRKLGRIEHLILAALLANGLAATAVDAKKRSKSKHSKSETAEPAESKTTSTSATTSAPASTTASTPTTTPAATPTASVTSTTTVTPSGTSTTTSASVAAPAPVPTPKASPNSGSATAATVAPTSAPPAATTAPPPVLVAPRVDLLPQTPGQICYVPRKVVSFQEEALIVPGPVTKRWNAGRVLYGLGTGLSMAATGVASIGGIIVAAGGSTASLSDPGPAMSLAGTVGNITGTTLLISGLAAQHSALGLIGKDSGRGKFIAGVVFGALGLASVGTGYIVGGMDIPNKDIINYAVGYGGTLLLTTASSILISDARNLRVLWDALGMRPAAPNPYQAQPQLQPAALPQQQNGFPPPG